MAKQNYYLFTVLIFNYSIKVSTTAATLALQILGAARYSKVSKYGLYTFSFNRIFLSCWNGKQILQTNFCANAHRWEHRSKSPLPAAIGAAVRNECTTRTQTQLSTDSRSHRIYLTTAVGFAARICIQYKEAWEWKEGGRHRGSIISLSFATFIEKEQ